MSAKLFKLFAVLFVVVVSLSACSGNVADSKQNCAEWDRQAVGKDAQGTPVPDAPINCKNVGKAAQDTVDASRQERIVGYCYDIASRNTPGGKPVIINADKAKGLWAYKWVNEFGQGNQDCGTPAPFAMFKALFEAGKVVPGK